MKRLKAYEIGSFPPHENPFWYDVFRMGTDVDSKLLVMHESLSVPDDRNTPYILIHKQTGRRFLVQLPTMRERDLMSTVALKIRAFAGSVRILYSGYRWYGFRRAIERFKSSRVYGLLIDKPVPHYIVVKINVGDEWVGPSMLQESPLNLETVQNNPQQYEILAKGLPYKEAYTLCHQ